MRPFRRSLLLFLATLFAVFRLLFLDRIPTFNLSNVLLVRPLIATGADERLLYPFGSCGIEDSSGKPMGDMTPPLANPYLMGLWSIYAGEWETAAQYFAQAIQMGRTTPIAAYALGVARVFQGDLDAAHREWQSGEAATRLRFLGRWCARMGDTQTAARYYQAALHSALKDDLDTYRETLLFFSATTDQEAYERSLHGFLMLTRPGTLDYNQTLGRVYLFRGHFEQAIALLSEAARQAPMDGANWYWAGVAAFKVGDYLQAKDDFVRAIALSPENVHSYLRLAETCLAMKDFGCARNAYQDALRLEPGNPTAQQGLEALDE
jgi:tetratricopeptide (TPR) repeat protein